METVSELKQSLYYRLDKNLDGNKIIQDIKRLVEGRENLSNNILQIYIKSISNDDTSIIPKLEGPKESSGVL